MWIGNIMIGSAKLRTGTNTGTRVFEECEQGELGRVCGHADDRRRNTSDLMGYDYEGSYRV